ncbi:hypothetical protein FQZ97_711280 [compost metagenome]
MLSKGVMPMPPATSTLWAASASSGKWLRGEEMVSREPADTASCMKREPPREVGSRLTATV